MIDRDQLREAVAWWTVDPEEVGENPYRELLVEAARLVVEGREVWWCEEHEAEAMDQSDSNITYCWHSFYLNQMATTGELCRMVRMILIDGNTE